MILHRFRLPIGEQLLPQALQDPNELPTERVVQDDVDLAQFSDKLEELRDEEVPPAKWDRYLAVALHRILREQVKRRVLLDPRFWHWMCIAGLPNFVWLRWAGSIPADPQEELTSSFVERFLGASSLRGISRNALARLFWCAETLWTPEDGYTLVQEALENQDFFQTIFERELGLYPDAAIACLRALEDSGEDERRQAVKRLNHYLTTVVLESISMREIEDLLEPWGSTGGK